MKFVMRVIFASVLVFGVVYSQQEDAMSQEPVATVPTVGLTPSADLINRWRLQDAIEMKENAEFGLVKKELYERTEDLINQSRINVFIVRAIEAIQEQIPQIVKEINDFLGNMKTLGPDVAGKLPELAARYGPKVMKYIDHLQGLRNRSANSNMPTLTYQENSVRA